MGCHDKIFFCINARIEEYIQRKTFFGFDRCLIIIDGYYEWAPGKIPYAFTKPGSFLLVAGLYNEEGFVAVTRDSDPSLKKIHDRMPLVFKKDIDMNNWLYCNNVFGIWNEYKIHKERSRFDLIYYKVSKLINDKKNTGPECIMSLEEYQKKYGLDGFFKKIDKNSANEGKIAEPSNNDIRKVSSKDLSDGNKDNSTGENKTGLEALNTNCNTATKTKPAIVEDKHVENTKRNSISSTSRKRPVFFSSYIKEKKESSNIYQRPRAKRVD